MKNKIFAAMLIPLALSVSACGDAWGERAATGGAIAATDDVTICLRAGRWREWATSADFDGALERPGIQLPLDG